MRRWAMPEWMRREADEAYLANWPTAKKNVGPFLALDAHWFRQRRRGLLWLANNRLTRNWFRSILCIMHDVPEGATIQAIRPNSITYGAHVRADGLVEATTDFRCHPKFAKRLYCEFEPVWYALHQWDAVFAERWVPAWDAGLLTLTAYPDPDPETTTVDGRVYRNPGGAGEIWATIIAGVGTHAQDSLNPVAMISITATTTTSQFNFMTRGITLFDTSALTASATISAATYSLYGVNKADGLSGTPDINAYAPSPAANTSLATGDYETFGSTALSTAVTYAGWSTTAYNDFALNAAGLSNISKVGVSNFGVRNANYDVAASSPPWVSSGNSNIQCNAAEASGTGNDPKLVVTYTVGTRTYYRRRR
jgi:hypothetical protein